MTIDEKDRQVIRALQGAFPLSSRPYAELAERAGLSEEEFLSRTRRMKENGAIRKMGAVLQHRKAGFKENVLIAWRVPPERTDEVCRRFCAHPRVSHCYDRNTAPDWPYNVYTMVHGQTREECESIARELASETGITERADRQMLYTLREWKKASLVYFC